MGGIMIRNRLLDELECVIPGPGYHAPQAPEPPEEAVVIPFPDDPSLVLPLQPVTMTHRGRPSKRRRRVRVHQKVAERHMTATKALLEGRVEETTLGLAMAYGKVRVSTMLIVLHILEDRGEVVRAGVARMKGGPVLWRLK